MNPEPSAEANVGPDLGRVIRPLAELARAMAAALMALLLLAAAVLCWRRLAGTLSNPLEPAVLVFIAAAAAATAATTRLIWRRQSGQQRSGPPGWVLIAAPLAAVVALGSAVSLPDTSPGGLVLMWLILAGEECWALGTAWRHRRFTRRRPSEPGRGDVRSDPPQTPATPAVQPQLDGPPSADVTQHLVRSHTAEGGEILAGWLRVPMAAGQRSASVHVAFCPDFATTPRMTVDQVGGPPARIKTVQLLTLGARLDVKLAAPSQAAASVLLQFLAEAAPPAGPASDPQAHRAEKSPEA